MTKMNKPVVLLLATLLSVLTLNAETICSPDSNIMLAFGLTPDGTPRYSVKYKGENIIEESIMGFETKSRHADFTKGFRLKDISHSSHSSTWVPVWGENDSIKDSYNTMTAVLDQKDGDAKMNIEFRVYNDGVGFRYIFPKQKQKEIVITEEDTEFKMPGDITAWWIPGDYDTQEYEYTRSRLSQIRSCNSQSQNGNISQHGFSPTGVQTSLMLKTDNDIYLNIHEAALIDFPAMHLNLDDTDFTFRAWLTPDRNGNKAEKTTPFSTPWRAIMISDKATGILASNLILNLNEPCKLKDTSWIKPIKYVGVWWEMITGKSTWSYCDAENFDLKTFDYTKAKPHGKHGANNENVKRYIDFAADNGFDQVLVEGWNIGWEDWFGKEKDYVFDFITPYPDFDIQMLNDYAHSKGIRLMMHHETSGSIPNYDKWIDKAYDVMKKYDYNAVKSGYVGNILPVGENHYNQNSVRHYLRCVTKAADKQIMVNGHEAVRPTGLCRTYPNLIGNESAMGNEYQNMSPTNVTILPFTRLKGGPMDFTPGILKADFGSFAQGNKEHKRATTANQLALYVTMYSPLQMAADLPQNYEEKADAFQFIKDVPVDWAKSIYLNAEPGEYIVVARKDKKSDSWFVGGVTNAEQRIYTLSFDFLDPDKKYIATIYRDGEYADCYDNPESYMINKSIVTNKSTEIIRMARGGGFAISISPAD